MKKLLLLTFFIASVSILFSQNQATEILKLKAQFKELNETNLVFVDNQNKEWEFYKKGSLLNDIKLVSMNSENKIINNPEFDGKLFMITYKWVDAQIRAGDENSDLVTKKVKVISNLEVIKP